MNKPPTSGDWRASALSRSTADWPFDWVAEITTVDPLSSPVSAATSCTA